MGEERAVKAAAGGAVETTVQEFLGLDDVEMQVVELRVRIAREVRRLRAEADLSQEALAQKIGVTQPRISSIEVGASASFDAVLMAYFAVGGSLVDLAAVVVGTISSGSAREPARFLDGGSSPEDEAGLVQRRAKGGALPKTG